MSKIFERIQSIKVCIRYNGLLSAIDSSQTPAINQGVFQESQFYTISQKEFRLTTSDR